MKLTDLYWYAYQWFIVHGPNIVFGLIILIVGFWLIRILKHRLQRNLSVRAVHSSFQPFFISLSIAVLNILLVLLVMQIWGIEATMLTTLVGAFGIAAGLALSGTLQNFAGGVLILLLKPFTLDDYIVAQGQSGKVTSIQIFYTVLLTDDNKTVIIPNGKLFNEVIVNVTREGSRRLDFEIDVTYGANAEVVKTIINEAIQTTPNIIKGKPTRVGVLKLGFDRVTYLVNIWVKPSELLATKLELHGKIINGLYAAGIKFPGT